MTETGHEERQLERLVFFSDAVFAIAITLLIIEVRLPAAPIVGEAGLLRALGSLIPQYIGFLVSFLVIGRFWVGHHRVFGWLARSDDTLVWRNLLFLLTIAFMPFPTSIVSRFASWRVGVCFYAGWLLLAGLFNLWTLRWAGRGPLLAADAPAWVRETRGARIPLVVATLALIGAAIHPLGGLIGLCLSPLVGRLVMRAGRPLPAT